MSTLPRFLLRLCWIYLGFAVMSAGIAATIAAHVGAGPWDVFHVAISLHLPVSVGQAMIGVGLLVVVVGWFLGVKPALGTLLNMLSVGVLVDFFLALLPEVEGPLAWVLLVAGVCLNGLGTGLYVSAGLGAGPRDGLMVGLTRRLGWPVGAMRASIEGSVALAGWLLGGPLGLGTVALALLLGPATQVGFAVANRIARAPGLRTFVEPVALGRRSQAQPASH
jgi:uncharacterized membrane protein YczE